MPTGIYDRKARPIEWIEKSGGCWECTSHSTKATNGGYPLYTWDGKQGRMSRFIYEQMFGRIPEGFVVMHKCDNPLCINPEHLHTGTKMENSIDMAQKGRNKLAKLTYEQVSDIKKDTRKLKEIAEDYGVGLSTISAIRVGQNWKHVGTVEKITPIDRQ